ncbi:MAG: hypothetical protein AB7C98_04530 [Acidithiobacillus sp.]
MTQSPDRWFYLVMAIGDLFAFWYIRFSQQMSFILRHWQRPTNEKTSGCSESTSPKE